MNSTQLIVCLVLLAVLIFGIVFWFKKCKVQVIDHVHLITGGVKSGKTTLAVATAISKYRSVHRAWKFKAFFFKLIPFLRKRVPEEPLLYSNIVLAVPYVPLTDDLINRKVRFRYKSVILIDEASLVADSFDIKNVDFNNNLKLFNKLIGHELHGGYLIYDTQSLSDCHFAVKRVLVRFTIITKCVKWIPFALFFKTCDVMYNADESVNLNNVFGDDTDRAGRYLPVRKAVWKKFDCYTYSAFTDDLPVADNLIELPKGASLKTKYIVKVRSAGRNE